MEKLRVKEELPMESNSNMHKAHHIYKRNREKASTLKMIVQELMEITEALHELLSKGEDFSHLISDELPLDSIYHCMPEDGWRRYDVYRPTSSRVNYLRWLMENSKPSQVRYKSLHWIIDKYTFIAAMITGKPLDIEMFFADNAGLLLGRYVIALENELKRSGIEFKNYCGITQKGWDTFMCRRNFNARNAYGFSISSA